MISIIAAICKNYVIGKNNDLIYHIPEDLSRFKKLTMNKTIIMGRKTFESLPFVLPNRKHIIITKNTSYKVIHKDVTIMHNISEIIKKTYLSDTEYFVIGGESIYKAFIPYAKKLYITEIQTDATDGDAFFPKIDSNNFEKIYNSEIKYCKSNNVYFSFNDYKQI